MADVRGGDSQVQGTVAAGSPDSGNPVKVGAVYLATPPSYSDGQRTDLQADSQGRLKIAADLLTALGLRAPYIDGASDATISSNSTMGSQFQTYRDLVINSGVVLTAAGSPQIVIARSINFGNASSRISCDALGGAGGDGSMSAAGVGGAGGFRAAAITTAWTDPPAAADGWSQLDLLFASGGAGGGSGAGAAGSAGGTSALQAWRLPFVIQWLLGWPSLVGGGGGGSGAGGTAGTTGASGGQRGGGGQTGSSTSGGGGGGSGLFGGGGGGGSKGSGNSNPGDGGAGGGIIWVIAGTVLGSAGVVSADGAAGLNSVGTDGGGGGGGGGGAVLVTAGQCVAVPTVRANGGAAGNGAGTGKNGAAGGAGLAWLQR